MRHYNLPHSTSEEHRKPEEAKRKSPFYIFGSKAGGPSIVWTFGSCQLSGGILVVQSVKSVDRLDRLVGGPSDCVGRWIDEPSIK
ncbi:hypothetical protein Bca101_026424 [Brassica carinata]